ncbi:MAG: ABC transporter ATP-binding protein [Candidatus Omnitrophica bacterium]|nr:ABC transporter ATP-binding protein [Candidatus Omnitrophota bacterium]
MSAQEAPRPIRHGLWALARFLRPYRWRVSGLIVLGIVASFLETVGISLLIPVLGGLSPHSAMKAMTGHFLMDALSHPFAQVPPAQRLQVIVTTMLGLILLKNLVSYVLAVWTEGTVISVERDLSLRVFDRLMTGTSYRLIARCPVGQLLTRLQSEPERAALALQGLIQMLSTLCLTTAYGVLLLLISWPLTLLTVALLLGLSWLLRWPAHRANAIGGRRSQAIAEVSQAGVEALSGMRVVRAFGREAFEQSRYRDRLRCVNALQLRGAGLVHLPFPLAESLSMTVLAVFLVMAAPRLVVQGGQMLPLLLTFLFVLYRLLPRVAYFHATWVMTLQ